MKVQWIGKTVLGLLVLVYAAPAVAEGVGECVDSIVRDTKRRNCWPIPFMYADRQAARQPFAAVVGNAWEKQNLLSGFHFDAETNQLTEAGRLRVLWILNEAPQQHRVVYVHRAGSPQETILRMQIVEHFVAQSAYGGQLAPVMESNRTDDGSPASRVDIIEKKVLAATPDPKLLTGGGGAGGGGAGGGGGGGGH